MKKQRKLLPSRPSGCGYSICVLAASEHGWQWEPECEPQKGWAGAWGGWRLSRGRLAPRLLRGEKGPQRTGLLCGVHPLLPAWTGLLEAWGLCSAELEPAGRMLPRQPWQRQGSSPPCRAGD